MKVYPKIPRYDHPVVPAKFFDAEDLTLVEKFDGSAFRFTLYDQRYGERYPDQVASAADGDGSLVFGTRKTVRGNHRDSLDEIDGALRIVPFAVSARASISLLSARFTTNTTGHWSCTQRISSTRHSTTDTLTATCLH
jgi:hypothetical protein